MFLAVVRAWRDQAFPGLRDAAENLGGSGCLERNWYKELAGNYFKVYIAEFMKRGSNSSRYRFLDREGRRGL